MKIHATLITLAILLLVAGCTQQAQPSNGRVVFTITDAAADMDAVSSIKVTVDSVQVHSESQGWVTVSTTPQTYDLLELKNEDRHAILADATLKEDSYNQIRFDISKVTVTDTTGDHQAKLPSGELKVNVNLSVQNGTTSTAGFDVVADESLHVTGKGEYILAPVMHVQTREGAQVETTGESAVVTGGRIKTDTTVGMDVNGNVGVSLRIPKNRPIIINANKIQIGTDEEVVVETDTGISVGIQTN